jgi:hypothetical protein
MDVEFGADLEDSSTARIELKSWTIEDYSIVRHEIEDH